MTTRSTRILPCVLPWILPVLVLAAIASGAMHETPVCAGDTSSAEPQTVDVFVNGVDGYPAYRIPSLLCTAKGTLLAFCEGRTGNDQSPTDMVLRRSVDGGKTWLPQQVIVKVAPDAAMDPTPVFDRTTGRVLLIYDRWPMMPAGAELGVHRRAKGLGRDSVTAWMITSDDEGATWSEPVDITAMTKKPEWSEVGHGPGIGIQTRSGRLVIPCFNVRYGETPEPRKWGVSWNHVIYSDDHGKTWRRSDNDVGPDVNENQLVELSDGSLVLNMRHHAVEQPNGQWLSKNCRLGATSKDGGRTWSEPFDVPQLPDANCQASILRYTWADGPNGKSRLLFSNPVGPNRTVGTIRLSYDEGKTWPVAKVICKDYFGYSCLTAMPNGDIGCLYEAAGCAKTVFVRFSLEWLTDGKDKQEGEK